MDLSNLTNTPGARERRKRVGRGTGSGMGKTSTRGHKGQNARKGHKQKLGFEGGQMPLVRRLPKRGFNNARFNAKALGVNLSSLEKFFDAGAEITVESLAEKGFSKAGEGCEPPELALFIWQIMVLLLVSESLFCRLFCFLS